MFRHRTVPAVVDETNEMADRLRNRCQTPVRAVFGFECGARSKSFLGIDETRRENLGYYKLILLRNRNGLVC